MAGKQGPEHWIGLSVMVTLNEATSDTKRQTGFLEGVNEAGVTLLLGAVVEGRPIPPSEPQYVFYPWHRIMLLARDVDPETESEP
jgi:hypothetical protein